MAKLLSGRVKKTPQSGLTSDRYQFLDLEQAEPDLGDPLIGPSSITANPAPPGDQYVLLNIGGETGKRYWIPTTSLQLGGLAPGSFTVFSNDVQVGIANSFNVFNFTGNGVSVDFVSQELDEQTGIATVRIQVTDVVAPGNEYEIAYHDPITGFLRGATDVVFRDNNVGIGSTQPTQKLDIIGNTNISNNLSVGNTLTVDVIKTNSLEIDKFTVSSPTVTFNVTSNSVGIGTTDPIATLDVRGTTNISGVATVNSLVSTNSVSSQTLGVASTASVGSLSIGSTQVISNSRELQNIVSVDTVTADTIVSAIENRTIEFNGTVVGNAGSFSQLRISGISTFTNGPVLIGSSVSIGTTSQILQVTGNSYFSDNLGVGITDPQYKVDIVGDSRIDGTLYVNNIITSGSESGQIVQTSSGILTTNSLNTVTLDSFGITTYRSAKYLIQITSNNSLGVGTTTSIKNLTRGFDYYPGVYSNVPLISSTGIGTLATATITVLPQFNLGITTCLSGVFTVSGSTVGITTGQTLFFNENLDILPLEQSKLTGVQLNSSGFGYTTFPTITVESPTISGNTVPGVGVGSTALVVVNSMIVKDFDISVGIATTAIPTLTLSGPSVGTTATGIVGFGVSTLSVINVGSGYTVSPEVFIPKVTGFSANAGLGVSSLNWQTTSGANYLTPVITVNGVNGIGTGAVIAADIDSNSPFGLINFRVTNPGIGYTVPPTVTITDSGGGTGAAVTVTTMTVSNVVVNNVGRGSTTGIQTSDIVVSPIGGIGTDSVLSVTTIIPTNVVVTNVGSGYTLGNLPVTATFSNPSIAATVLLGVETISITSSGIGYTTLPTLTFSSPTLGIGSTATASSTKLGYDATRLFNGPGFGGTEAVYYVQPLTSNTFGISTTSGGSIITLGYDVTPSTTKASIGGTVNTVDITFGGSGYVIDDIITASNFDLSRVDTNVGIGFSFRVNSTVNSFQISDLLVIQSAFGGNSNAFVVESNGISDAFDLGEFSADISGDFARLRFSPVYADNVIKFYKTLFTI